MRTIRKIIVHHTAGPDTATVMDVRRVHVEQNGWSDIGYHWLVYRSMSGQWVARAGRPEVLVGAHDRGQNGDSIGIAIAGRYHEGPVPTDGWALLALTTALTCLRYGLGAGDIEGHCENEPSSTQTLCPGFSPETFRITVAAILFEAYQT